MAYSNSGWAHQGNWPQNSQGDPSSGSYSHALSEYPNRGSRTHPQPGAPYYPPSPPDGRSNSLQYTYSGHNTPALPHTDGTSTSNGTCFAYPAGYQTAPCENTTSHYPQPTQPFPYAQHSQAANSSQRVLHSHYVTSPVAYASPQLPLVTPRMNVDTNSGYTSSSSWAANSFSVPGSSTGQHVIPGRQMGSGAEYVVPCPYDCGTVLTGVHAVGNMTRHLRSQNCIGSGKDKTKYACPMPGCEKRYIRSDGLKVHLRKRHNISHAPDRNGSSEYEETGYN